MINKAIPTIVTHYVSRTHILTYSTLFRSHEDVHAPGVLHEPTARGEDQRDRGIDAVVVERRRAGLDRDDGRAGVRVPARSEEHTSELQSPCNLVCRLMLAKKNNLRIRLYP